VTSGLFFVLQDMTSSDDSDSEDDADDDDKNTTDRKNQTGAELEEIEEEIADDLLNISTQNIGDISEEIIEPESESDSESDNEHIENPSNSRSKGTEPDKGRLSPTVDLNGAEKCFELSGGKQKLFKLVS